MDELRIPAAFERVWERVNTFDDSDSLPETVKAELERHIECEQCAIEVYSAIAGRCGPKERRTVYQIISEERRHLQSLQIEYFMLTGSLSMPKPTCVLEKPGLLTMLRRAYLNELEAAQSYTKAAKNRKNELAEIYLSCAEDEQQHARQLKEMISRAI